MLSTPPSLPTKTDLAIIGAGPHTLTLVTHLLQKRQNMRGKILVFDKGGKWMNHWQHQFAALEIPHLRSPAVHHPDPNPFALRKFAESRNSEFFPPYDLPGTQLFEDFCNDYHYCMNIPKITVVAGLAGAGKTTWITQQIACSDNTTSNILYFSPGTGNVPIDQTRIKSEYPTVKVFGDGQEVEFLNQLSTADAVYIELGFYLELNAITPILDNLSYRAIAQGAAPYRNIAILPPHLQDSEYHTWAEEIKPGAAIDISITPTQL
ncbi:hypothetical protein FIS3754_43510 [Fischerella sp. NIES-3754]|nr:hypothetical protein FIS3754_43510 [Fischerella sp. NIES-3754]